MKKYAGTFLKTMLFANLGFLLVAAIVRYRLNISYPFISIETGAILFSLLVAGGIRILRASRGNAVVNAILGLIMILPAIVVMRVVFSIAVFRFAFVVYVFASVAAIAYASAVVVSSLSAKKAAKDLNELLPPHSDSPQE
jgi:putative effector of murein hydrolase LrgA (UPF0299 family)